MTTDWSLRQRLTAGLLGYSLVLTLVVLGYGYIVHESAEQVVWKSLLQAELDHFLERRRDEPDYVWPNTDSLKLYVEDQDQVSVAPPALRGLDPGVHDDVDVDGRDHVVLVRVHDGQRFTMALDINSLERNETQLGLSVIVAALLAIGVLNWTVAWGVGRLVNPLKVLANRIEALKPGANVTRLEETPDAGRELAVIRDAINDFLDRNAQFVLRERAFIDMASHELRTPIAVIRGASEIAALQVSSNAAIDRILRTTRQVEQLIELLLVLARDPLRLAQGNELVRLEELLPQIINDHQHLCRDKDLIVTLQCAQPCTLEAPPSLLQAAIGNLLRNAIESSDRGEIRVVVDERVVSIEDPGHGMTPEEISRIHAQRSRSGVHGGIGLDLIGRLCQHLGWQLAFESRRPQGTRAWLRFGTD